MQILVWGRQKSPVFPSLKNTFYFHVTGGNICRIMAATSSPLLMRYLRFSQTHQNSLGAETVPCHSLQILHGDAIISITTVWAGYTGLQIQLYKEVTSLKFFRGFS